MEIRSLEVDIDRGILKINGKEVEDPTIVTLPGPDGWLLSRAFNTEKRNQEEFNRIEVIAKNADFEKTSRSQREEKTFLDPEAISRAVQKAIHDRAEGYLK